MTYYNLPPTRFANEYNDFEKSLRALPADGAIKGLDLLETITRNTAQNPKEEKFRRVRSTNEKLAPLFSLPGSIAVMKNMGWEQEGEFMVLPKSITLDFPQHVVKILEAKSHFGKLQEQEKRAAKLSQDPNKATMLKQLELDRRERSADGYAKTVAPAASTEEAELAEAIRLSMEAAPEAKAETPSPPKTPVSDTPAVPAVPTAAKGDKKESAFDFKRREDPEKKRQEQETSLADIRALQKQKFKDFQADPDAKKSEAYQKPPTIGPGGSEEKGWFDWMWGGSSSSSGGGGGGGQGGGGGGGGGGDGGAGGSRSLGSDDDDGSGSEEPEGRVPVG